MTDLALAGRASAASSRPVTAAERNAPPAYVAEIRSGAAAYVALGAEWRALAARQETVAPFQTPDFLAIWARHFGTEEDSLRTVLVRQAGRIVLIWPLQLSRRGPLRLVGGAGGPIAQYDEVLVDPDCDAPAVLRAAIEAARAKLRPDVLMFDHVRRDGWLIEALGPVAVQLGAAEAAPFADITGGVDGLKASLKTRVIQQQRKRIRKMESAGSIGFDLARDPEQTQEWLSELLAVKRRWLVATGRLSRAFVDSRTAACLSDLVQSLTEPAACPRLAFFKLSLDGEMAAMEFGFVHNRCYHLYLGAFSEELARFGPGNVLTEKVMEWCVGQGIQRYDMMAPRSRNKGEWQSGEVEVSDWLVPLTARGRVYARAVPGGVAPAVRAAFYALPDPLRSALADRALKL